MDRIIISKGPVPKAMVSGTTIYVLIIDDFVDALHFWDKLLLFYKASQIAAIP